MSILKSIVLDRERVAKFNRAVAYEELDDSGEVKRNEEGRILKGCNIYYTVDSDEGKTYEFPIDMGDYNDVGSTSFESEIKAATLMRYIRRAIKDETLIELHNEG